MVEDEFDFYSPMVIDNDQDPPTWFFNLIGWRKMGPAKEGWIEAKHVKSCIKYIEKIDVFSNMTCILDIWLLLVEWTLDFLWFQFTGNRLGIKMLTRSFFSFTISFVFPDAFSHFYTRMCPSVNRSVRRSVRHTRVEFLRNGISLNKRAWII